MKYKRRRKKRSVRLYRVVNGHKYIGDKKKVVARSSWEYKVFSFLDRSDLIGKWSSEEISIPYVSPVDGKVHRYYPDIYYETVNGNKFLVEIKPYKFTIPPEKPRSSKMATKKEKRSYYRALALYNKNKAKWKAAEEFCKRNGFMFVILTEHEIRDLRIPL